MTTLAPAATETELLGPPEFRDRIMEITRTNSANRGPFIQALYRGELSRDVLRRWSKEFYHFARWMATPGVASPSGYLAMSRDALAHRVDNAMGELGYRQDEVHPNLVRALAFELGVGWDELRDYVPLPTTIWYMRQRLGTKPAPMGAATNILEADNQETCAMLYEALPRHYGLPEAAVAYFEVHRVADVQHTDEFIAILVEACDTRSKQEEALAVAADALGRRRRVFNGWCELVEAGGTTGGTTGGGT